MTLFGRDKMCAICSLSVKYCILLILSLPGLLFPVNAQTELSIYGGKNHDQFLGCINCSDQNIKSIWCIYGDFGSTHGPKSIWNEQGMFGSKRSQFSPYNPLAKYPPLIIDEKRKITRIFYY
ncbi:hypothetical protein [Mucilaginibacter celer]|uniref:hypothetical protein n=1 Tax=Mucilaginibacter celer TaxID=2305508 RepID=UPI0013CEA149|nr:hypothetical protein [Mucilaginibacter celer]